jgi:ribonuclease VapC
MVIDASAVIAILRAERETDIFLRAIVDAQETLMSAVNFNEACLVLAGRRGGASEWQPLDALVQRAGVEIVPFDLALATGARMAFLRFGKGRHPAALNLGDCAAYALAKARDLPLLFKGNDFARTDITPAISPLG